MTATRDARVSARSRLSASSPPSAAREANTTASAATPSTAKLALSEVALIKTGASAAPANSIATDTPAITPRTRPRASSGTTRASAVSATTSQVTNPAPPTTVTSRATGRTSVAAYTSCVAQYSAAEEMTTTDTRVPAARRPLTTALNTPPTPSAASSQP